MHIKDYKMEIQMEEKVEQKYIKILQTIYPIATNENTFR
jgi:hypothetical protein